jgi:hypothetical protein
MQMKLTHYSDMPAACLIDSSLDYVIMPKELWLELMGDLTPDQTARFYDLVDDCEDGPYDVNFRR